MHTYFLGCHFINNDLNQVIFTLVNYYNIHIYIILNDSIKIIVTDCGVYKLNSRRRILYSKIDIIVYITEIPLTLETPIVFC